ncbi:MAG: malto-oligosyltrehalose synthase, partial [Candidatus Rokubacteria bacterium]|nr:malto-oligosyltrehalose synthase [Candidatus Rokubacteria bacterium]
RTAGDDRRELVRDLLATWADGRVKLYLIHRALELRRADPDLFTAGGYRPLPAAGARAEHALAFARLAAPDIAARVAPVIAVAPRLTARLAGLGGPAPVGPDAWGDTWLPLDEPALAVRYRDVLTGAVLEPERRGEQMGLALARVLSEFPVALLHRADGA